MHGCHVLLLGSNASYNNSDANDYSAEFDPRTSRYTN